MPVPYAAIAAAAAPTVAGLFGKKNKVEEPKEIQAARNLLLNFARTGEYGGFKAGAEVPLGYGDHNVTGIEQEGLSSLQRLLSSGIPDQFRMGDEALRASLATDPAEINAQFDPFKQRVEREITDAETAHKRSAAYAGNLYSTDTIAGLGDIRARGNETMTSELSRLTDQFLQRRLQAVPLAYQSGEAQESLGMGRIDASQRYGGLTRNLNDASIKARDAEILRRREELKLPITAAETVLNGPSQMPIEQSPYQALLGQIGQIGGRFLGDEMFMSQYKRFFPGGAAPTSPTQAGLPASRYAYGGSAA